MAGSTHGSTRTGDGIDNDLKQISELGMDHVRIFPIWPYLQPNRTWINKKGVADVRRMVHIAGEHGLDVYVDVFQGHLSSFDFLLHGWSPGMRATCSPMRTPLRPSVNWSRP